METLVKSSSMVRGKLSSLFDLELLFEYIEVDIELVSISFDKKIKTKTGISPFKTFKSGVCVKMNTGESIKIFSTGSYSISGAGNIDSALKNGEIALKKLLEKIKKIDYSVQIHPEKYQGFYTYKQIRIIDSKVNTKGLLKKGCIVVGKKTLVECEFDNRLYCEKTHKDKKKKLYNNMLDLVGEIEYKMIRKSKSLCLKGTEYEKKDETCFYIRKGQNLIGMVHVHLVDNSSLNLVVLPETLEMKVQICDPQTKIESVGFSNNNCNTRVKLRKNSYLDRNAICEHLNTLGIHYTYDPCSYPGIKFKIDDTKVTIFRTGSILFSSKDDVTLKVFPFIKNLFKTDFTKTEDLDECEDIEEISIWDL